MSALQQTFDRLAAVVTTGEAAGERHVATQRSGIGSARLYVEVARRHIAPAQLRMPPAAPRCDEKARRTENKRARQRTHAVEDPLDVARWAQCMLDCDAPERNERFLFASHRRKRLLGAGHRLTDGSSEPNLLSMAKQRPSQAPKVTEPQREAIEQLRKLEREGRFDLVELPSNDDSVVFRTIIKSSPDPVIAQLIDIHRQLDSVAAAEGYSPAFRLAVDAAQIALTKAALLAGAIPIEGHDAEAGHIESIARARVALKGMRADDAGLRAQVHNVIDELARQLDFARLSDAQQTTAARLLADALPARAGGQQAPDMVLVTHALRQMVCPKGRPKGSLTDAPAKESPSQRKWRTLHKLFGELGIAGSSASALRREISATQKGKGR